jgi:3-phenylpropionate/trans-cinnamate dioxygenase ferredoxin reductase subunit
MKTVIIGAGQAAIQTILSLRQGGYDGDITLIGDEQDLPYQRPPLSKKFMTGEMEKQRLYLRPADYYAEQNIETLLQCSVTAISRTDKTVTISDGTQIAYDKLVIATGSRPRQLPLAGIERNGIHDLRSIADVAAIIPEVQPHRKLVIIGGGYIGLETAAACRQKGLDVTVLEAAPRVLARVADPFLSHFFTELHQRHGVTIETDCQISELAGDGYVEAVNLASGKSIAADFVVMGVGIVANVELATAAGLSVDNGIVVDENCLTSDPDIYAAGDCSNHPNNLIGHRLRLESVPNAIEQGKTVAAHMLGTPAPYHQIPWFWSDQYDIKLQICGLPEGVTASYTRGEGDSFARYHFRDQQLVAVEAVNRPAEFMAGRQMVEKACHGMVFDPDRLVDPSQTPKNWLAELKDVH